MHTKERREELEPSLMIGDHCSALTVDYACVMSWMVENAADVINRYQIHVDGRGAYERVKGRKHQGEVFEFATPVMHRELCERNRAM